MFLRLGLTLASAALVLAQKPPAPKFPAPTLPQVGPGLYAVVETSMGNITVELFEKQAPLTVRNFVGLATGSRPWFDPKTRKMVARPLYDNLTFHRVIPGFMIQTGDPTGTGTHDCGFVLPDEIVGGLLFDRPGRLAMANIGKPNTGACQFFITEAPYRAGDGKYTIFGQVIDGQPVVSKIAHVIRDDHDKPRFPIKLIHVAILRVVAQQSLSHTDGGSGIFVNAAGDVLTSSRVVQGCKEVHFPDGTHLQMAVLDPRNGLAVLHSGKKPDSFAVFADGEGVAAQQPIFAAGAAATVSAAGDAHGDRRYFQITSKTKAAEVGGPVLDSSGKLVGVLAGAPEDAPDSAHLAVQSTVAMGFLDSGGVAYTKAAPGAAVDPGTLGESARQSVVELQCWK